VTYPVTPTAYDGPMTQERPQAPEWMGFPGGELEGERPRALCPTCRRALAQAARRGQRRPTHEPRQTACFQCYRAELERRRALAAAGALVMASDARFQVQLPFEPVDRPRLAMLKASRAAARATGRHGAGRFVDARRRAQIAARHALQQIAAGLRARHVAPPDRAAAERAFLSAVHAAELQLPESWLPFVVSR
jgi:hypothetical protein